jgi:hypothetical protein
LGAASNTTPTTTKNVNAHTEYSHGTDEISRVLTSLSKADIALSRAEMELSKAEGSVTRLEAVWIKAAKITIVGLLGAIVYGLWIIIVAEREELVYKKFIKSQNKA